MRSRSGRLLLRSSWEFSVVKRPVKLIFPPGKIMKPLNVRPIRAAASWTSSLRERWPGQRSVTFSFAIRTAGS